MAVENYTEQEGDHFFCGSRAGQNSVSESRKKKNRKHLWKQRWLMSNWIQWNDATLGIKPELVEVGL